MKSLAKRLFSLLLLLAVTAGTVGPVFAGLDHQAVSPPSKAQALLARLTPEERVGQLFLLTFNGTDVSDRSTIYDLIVHRHIGGVMLSRKNNNFNDAENLVTQVSQMTGDLQRAEWNASLGSLSSPATAYIPLWIGISQEGDQYPYDQLLSGVTPLPDLMTLGATWNPELSQKVGDAMGSEMEALGFNLFFGPSLDVLDVLYTGGSDDLGVRAFGGDPYWTSLLGQAYISGIHTGSSGRIATVVTHFPGRGSSDRQAETEIATIRKSLAQLKQNELAPFFSVTGQAANPSSTTDGLLLSHIRYQGLQGNVRDNTTRPISFDQAALADLLKLDAFAPWRDNGGLLVSEDLGSPALRKFFDPTGNNFDARQVARNALLAGNDLLYADNFLASGDADVPTTIANTLVFLTQKYNEDPVFAQRVNASVERILTLKFRIYPQFAIDQVLPAADGLTQLDSRQQVALEVASKAATLISPDPAELANVLPRPPGLGERIVFITDDQSGRQCGSCADRPSIATDALQNSVVRLYGSQSSAQVSRTLLSSYTFTDLYQLLLQQTLKKPLDEDLKLANWIVFAVLKPSPDRPETNALKRLLAERPDLIRNKHLIVFAFNAPYYLDATDISKLTAYYGLYSKSTPFIDLAARILFQEHIPSGSLPISVPGAGYDLFNATSPDPAQLLSLNLDLPEAPTPSASGTKTAEPTEVPKFKLGDTLKLRTNVILDHNQHPVPDYTVVRFSFSAGNTPGLAQTIEAGTKDGIARVSYKIERGELLDITVSSNPAFNSTRLILDVSGGESAAITLIAPTTEPTLTPTVTMTPTATVTLTPTLTPTPVPATIVVRDWALSLGLALLSAALLLWIGMSFAVPRWALRWGLCTLIGGLIGYNYFAFELPGSQVLLERYGSSGVMAITGLGALSGALIGLAWQQISIRRQPAKRVSAPSSPED